MGANAASASYMIQFWHKGQKMLALKIDNPIVEQYFHNNPKEANDLLEAIATKKIILVAINEQSKTVGQLDKLKSVLGEFQNVKVFQDIEDSVEWQRQIRDEW